MFHFVAVKMMYRIVLKSTTIFQDVPFVFGIIMRINL